MRVTDEAWEYLRRWLDGDQSVESQVLWGGHHSGDPGGVLLAMTQRALALASRYVRYLPSWQRPSRDELENLALGHAWEVLSALRQKKTSRDFRDPAALGAYLEKALRGIIDLVNADLNLTPNSPVSLNQPLPAGNGGEDGEGLTLQERLADPGPGPEEVTLGHREASELLRGFADHLRNRAALALYQHLCLIVEYFQDLIAAVEFLQDTATHYSDLVQWLMARGLQPATVRQRNLRLRAVWREFLAGPGRHLCE